MAMSVTYATVHGRLVEENRGGVVTEYVPDTLGNVIMTTDESGTVTSTTTYWPFGEVRTQTGTNPSPWGFCGVWGYVTDAVSRMYVRARHYRADTSRWLTVDPIWPTEPAYVYCRTSPATYIDPSGLAIKFIDCSEDQKNALNEALRKVREWWGPPGSGHYGPGDDNLFGPFQNCLRNSGCRCNHPTRYDAEPVPCIEDFLNGQEPLNINCRPGWGPRTGNLRVHRNCDRDGSKTTCAWTDFRANPPWINICPDGFSRCDLACVIAHELIHACGASHIGGSQGCFDCIPKLPGCSKYTYGSSKELVDPR